MFAILLKYYAKRSYLVLFQVNRSYYHGINNRTIDFSDELRHIIGSETTRRGLLRLFELLQNETLNRRFAYMVIEALLIKLFRPNDLHLIFERLYSRSPRVKEEYRRRIFEQEHYHNSVIGNQQHYSELSQRSYYLNRLSVRNDDDLKVHRSNSVQPQKTLPRSLSKISK